MRPTRGYLGVLCQSGRGGGNSGISSFTTIDVVGRVFVCLQFVQINFMI
jgi:hypothetical protein